MHEIRDASKYCEYKESPGHTKIECLQLKDELERRARLGKEVISVHQKVCEWQGNRKAG